MAATRLIPLHVSKGRTVAQCLGARTDYAKNPEKTEKGEMVTAYGCDPMTVDEEFLLSKRQYEQATGRRQKNNIIAYQIRQSFKPGEITPEEANRIGRELAMRFTKGKYAFIVATHTDKAHIHNHIIFNSTALDGSRKFRNFWLSSLALQRTSDLLCLENGLSVIEPKPYREREKRTEYPQKQTIRSVICSDIDAAISQKPTNLEELLKLLEEAGYEIKRGKNISLRGKNQQRFIRLNSLDEGYRQQDLIDYFSGEKSQPEKAVQPKTPPQKKKARSLTLDIQSRLQKLAKVPERKGAGYQRWASVYNLKQMSKTLLFLRDHKIDSLDQLDVLASEMTAKRDALLTSVQTSEKRLTEIEVLRKHIINYSKTRTVYEEYRRSGYSKKFLEAHREAITLHKAAKQAFDELGVRKIPRVKELSAEYAQVLAEKKKQYAEFRQVRDEMQEVLIAQRNIASLFEAETREDEQRRRRQNEQNR